MSSTSWMRTTRAPLLQSFEEPPVPRRGHARRHLRGFDMGRTGSPEASVEEKGQHGNSQCREQAEAFQGSLLVNSLRTLEAMRSRPTCHDHVGPSSFCHFSIFFRPYS